MLRFSLPLSLLLCACGATQHGSTFDGSVPPGADGAPLEETGAGLDAGMQAATPRDAGRVSDANSAPQDAHDAAECAADGHEPDGTLTEAEAHEPVSGIFPVELSQLTACPGDTDYVWGGRVDAGGKAGARLTWDTTLGELQLTLCDADGVPLAQRDVSSASAGHAEERVDEYYGSFFYVRVTNSGSQSIPYDLTVSAQVFGP